MSEKEELKEGLSTYINMMETEKGEKIEKITIENDIKYRFLFGITMMLLGYSLLLTIALVLNLLK